jgi:hypothetical protein
MEKGEEGIFRMQIEMKTWSAGNLLLALRIGDI